MLVCEVYRKCHENLASEKMSAGHIRNLEKQAVPVQQEPVQVEAKETKRIVRR
jgi:hypothetical protein